MNTKEQFLLLLRIGLWGGEANPENFPTESTDWKGIYKLAEQQTVVGIVYDGLSTLPIELQPDQHLLRKWYIHVLRIENSHNVLNKTLVEIFSLYEEAGFTPILLKGQGIAQCYRNPSHRNCGDIDVYLGKKDYERSKDLLFAKGYSKKDLYESLKDFGFNYKGISIENHKIVSSVHHQLSNNAFYIIVNKWYPSDLRKTIIENKEIKLPPVWFDSFYILLHISEHFFQGGIGLRQLSDWCCLLHSYKDEIDPNLLRENLKILNLEKIWGAFAYVAVTYLGLPKEDMPFYEDRFNTLGEKILSQIFKEGNFGQHSKGFRPKGYIKGKFHNLKYTLNRLSKVASIFPKESMIAIPMYIHIGIGQVLKDKL